MDETKWGILRADFPKEAYSDDNSRGFKLTTINAYYIIERLNKAFGLGNWGFKVKEWIKTPVEVICIGDLLYSDGDKEYSIKDVVGAHRAVKDHWGDAYKSARTNAISKGASELEVGLNVYKGEFKTESGQNQSQPSQGTSKPTPVNQDPDGGDGKLISDGNAMIQAMTGGDTQKAIELVRKHSGFDGIEGRVERSSLEQLKGKWLFKTFKNIESEYSSFVDKENSEMQIDEPPVDPAQDTENVPF